MIKLSNPVVLYPYDWEVNLIYVHYLRHLWNPEGDKTMGSDQNKKRRKVAFLPPTYTSNYLKISESLKILSQSANGGNCVMVDKVNQVSSIVPNRRILVPTNHDIQQLQHLLAYKRLLCSSLSPLHDEKS